MRSPRKQTLVALLLFTILMCGLLLNSFAENGKITSENGGKVNIRKAPEEKARIVTRIRNGETVEVLEHDGNWYHVRFKGKEGYIKEQFVILLSTMIGKDIYSNGGTLYLREKPDDTNLK